MSEKLDALKAAFDAAVGEMAELVEAVRLIAATAQEHQTAIDGLGTVTAGLMAQLADLNTLPAEVAARLAAVEAEAARLDGRLDAISGAASD